MSRLRHSVVIDVGESGLFSFRPGKPAKEVIERPVLHRDDDDVVECRAARIRIWSCSIVLAPDDASTGCNGHSGKEVPTGNRTLQSKQPVHCHGFDFRGRTLAALLPRKNVGDRNPDDMRIQLLHR